jgi:4-amino-4-deoxy-L-arabinose transferase-like glycosyltransferase
MISKNIGAELMDKRKITLSGPIPYLLLGAALAALYALFSAFTTLPGMTELKYSETSGVAAAEVFTLISVLAASAAAALMLLLRRFSFRRGALFAVLAGIVMRFGYMLRTPFFLRGHDIGTLSDSGHFAYIYHVFSTFSLPQSFDGQFYHPPLNYILCAAAARVYSFFTGCQNPIELVEAARLVPCFASCALLFVCLSLFDEIGMDRKASFFAILIISFHPTFFILSASVNNDMLMILFFMTSLLYTAKWFHKRTCKNAALLGMFIGLAAMTKLSGAVAVLAAAAAFIAASCTCTDGKSFIALLKQAAVFFAVFLPLGLWYSIRNYILFGQKFGYVLQISFTSSLYSGAHSFAARFLSFPLTELMKSPFCSPFGGDYAIWPYTLKCSVFGEFDFSGANALLISLLLSSNFFLIIVSLAAMAATMIKFKDVPLFSRLLLFGTWLVMMVSFISFNVKYPFACTMDFRYIVPTAITGAAFIGILQSHRQDRFTDGLAISANAFTALFVIASAAFYIVL